MHKNAMRFVTRMDLGILGRPDSEEMWSEIISHIPDSLLLRPDLKILNFACGHGTEARLLFKRMLNLGIPREKVQQSFWMLDKYQWFLNSIKISSGITNLIAEDFITWQTDMKFDIVIGNPPFNSTPAGARRATAGDTGLYKRFYKTAKSLVKDTGIVAMITPKGIIKNLVSDHDFNTETLNLMTDTRFWGYNTCYFIGTPGVNRKDIKISDKIIGKLFMLTDAENCVINHGGLNLQKTGYTGLDKVDAIIALPTAKTDIQYSTVTPNTKIVTGPKFVGTKLDNPRTYITTADPVAAPYFFAIKTKTIEEAQKIQLFVENSKLLKAIRNKLNTKGILITMRHLKPFDPNQIVTGLEIPKEWNLTDEDLDKLQIDLF